MRAARVRADLYARRMIECSVDAAGGNWDRLGAELRRLDPELFAQIYALVRAAVLSHVDPLLLRQLSSPRAPTVYEA